MFDEFSLRLEGLGADEAALLLVGVIDADVVTEVLDGLDEDDGAVAVLEGAPHAVRPRLGVDDDVVGGRSAVREGRARRRRDAARVVHAHHVFGPTRRRYENLRTLGALEVHAALLALSRMLDQHVAVLGLNMRVRSVAKSARKALRLKRRRSLW